MLKINREIGEILTRGYTSVDIPSLTPADRLRAARIGITVIDQAMVDEKFASIVSTTLAPDLVASTNPTVFGVSGPRNTDDSKVYWHCGYQVLDKIRSASPKDVPGEIRTETDFLEYFLDECCTAWKATAEKLLMPEATVLQIVPEKRMERNIHLRTVRYVGSASIQLFDKVFDEHADLGVGTLRLWENAANTLRAVAVPNDMFYDDDDALRTDYIKNMFTNAPKMRDLHDNEAHFFWGGGINGINKDLLGDSFPRSYPILYHGGDVNSAQILPHEGMDIASSDRVALLAFMNPSVRMLSEDTLFGRPYTIPTVRMCRPGKKS
jgi:hypothetical protein